MASVTGGADWHKSGGEVATIVVDDKFIERTWRVN